MNRWVQLPWWSGCMISDPVFHTRTKSYWKSLYKIGVNIKQNKISWILCGLHEIVPVPVSNNMTLLVCGESIFLIRGMCHCSLNLGISDPFGRNSSTCKLSHLTHLQPFDTLDLFVWFLFLFAFLNVSSASGWSPSSGWSGSSGKQSDTNKRMTKKKSAVKTKKKAQMKQTIQKKEQHDKWLSPKRTSTSLKRKSAIERKGPVKRPVSRSQELMFYIGLFPFDRALSV